MQRDPADRYESAEAMAAALLGEEPDDDATATARRAPDPTTHADGCRAGGRGDDGTVRFPRVEHTARLPSGAPTTKPRRAGRLPSRTALIVGAAILALSSSRSSDRRLHGLEFTG